MRVVEDTARVPTKTATLNYQHLVCYVDAVSIKSFQSVCPGDSGSPVACRRQLAGELTTWCSCRYVWRF